MIVRCTWIHANGDACGFVGEAGVSAHKYTCPQCGMRRNAPRERPLKRRLKVAEERNAILEQALVNVWRWTNDGHPHLELLIPLLLQADRDSKVITELALIEDALTDA